MSDKEATAEVPWYFQIFYRSTATYSSILVGGLLVALAATSWTIFYYEEQRIAWSDYITWSQLMSLFLLWSGICWLTYWTVKVWTGDIRIGEKELIAVWEQGMQQLERGGVAFRSRPLFLVLGCYSAKQQKSFIRHASIPQPLEWIGLQDEGKDSETFHDNSVVNWCIAKDRVFLFCNHASHLSRIQRALSKLDEHHESRWQIEENSISDSRIDASEESLCEPSLGWEERDGEVEPEHTVSNRSHLRVIRLGDLTETMSEKDVAVGIKRSGEPPLRERVTSQVVQSAMAQLDHAEALVDEFYSVEESKESIPGQLSQNLDPILSEVDSLHIDTQLRDLVGLVRSRSRGVAPWNGVIAWVEGPTLAERPEFGTQMGRALNRDLAHLQTLGQILTPVTFVIGAMDQVVGFRELIRRFGPSQSSSLAIGETFETQRIADELALRTAVRRASGNLGQMIHYWLRKENGALRPGNGLLFRLSIKVRGAITQSLTHLVDASLDEGYGEHQKLERPIVNGIYFVATGEKEIERGFLKKVFQRIYDRQGQLVWNQQHRKRTDQMNRMIQFVQLAALSLILMGVFQLIYLMSTR